MLNEKLKKRLGSAFVTAVCTCMLISSVVMANPEGQPDPEDYVAVVTEDDKQDREDTDTTEEKEDSSDKTDKIEDIQESQENKTEKKSENKAEKTEKILDIKVNYKNGIEAIAKYRTEIDKLKDAEKDYKKLTNLLTRI